MTIDDVKNLSKGAILHYTGANGWARANPCTRTVGPRGGVTEKVINVRINGAVQTWKRDLNRVSAPFKYGFREYGYITEHNCEDFHLAKDCPLVS